MTPRRPDPTPDDEPLLRELRAGIAERLVQLPPPALDMSRLRPAPRRGGPVILVAGLALALGTGVFAAAVVRQPATVRPSTATPAAPALPAGPSSAAPVSPPPASAEPPPGTVTVTDTPQVTPAPTAPTAPTAPGSGPGGTECVPVAPRSPALRQLVLLEVRIAAQPAVDDLNGQLTAVGIPPWQPTDDEIGELVGIDQILDDIADLPAYDCAGRLDVTGVDEAEVRAQIARNLAAALSPTAPRNSP